MAADGYQRIVNTDISGVVIDQMNADNKFPDALSYVVSDCTDMHEYADASWDIVLDKGTTDSMLWSLDPFGFCYKYYAEVTRILKEGGT